MRAKFKCDFVESHEDYDRVHMAPVVGNGGEENKSFSEATPSGQLELIITNPGVIGTILPGRSYYIDITAAG